jgi:hypothetical protein
MTYDISFLWIWLALAVLVGAAVGWRTNDPGPQGVWAQGWPRTALTVWAVAVVAVVIHLLAGRLAFWLESATLFSAAYVAGALLGGWLRGRRVEV